MLSRTFGRSRAIYTQHTRFFSAASPAGYPEYQKRIADLQKQYPGLYKDAQSFQTEQKKVIESAHANLDKSIQEYNQARQKLADACGEDVFITLSPEEVQNFTGPVQMTERPMQEIQRQFAVGNTFIEKLITLQKMDGMDETQKTLRWIEIQDLMGELDAWMARLEDDVDDPGDLGLPLPDKELDDLVRDMYYRAPPNVKAPPTGMTEEQHTKVEDDWLASLDDMLGAEIAKRVENFDQAKWKAYSQVLNELFHPRDIDHYPLNEYSKSLIRAVFWQGKERFDSVVQSVEDLAKLHESGGEAVTQILRGAYEMGDAKNKGIAAMQLRLSDPLFSARLVQKLRKRMDASAFDLSVKDALRALELPLLQAERKEVEAEKAKGATQAIERKLDLIKEAEAQYNRQMDTLESVLDEMLPGVCWGNDTAKVKQAVLAYATDKGALADVNKAFDQTVAPNANAEPMDEQDITFLAVNCHNAKMADSSTWAFADLLNQTRFTSSEEEVLMYRRKVKEVTSKLGFDPLVTNLLRVMVEDEAMDQLPSTIEDFGYLVKKYLGEVEATIQVAENVSDEDFNSILAALQKANPDKKFTVQKIVEPALMGGFIVKAGVQTFDYSLTTQVGNARRQMNV